TWARKAAQAGATWWPRVRLKPCANTRKAHPPPAYCANSSTLTGPPATPHHELLPFREPAGERRARDARPGGAHRSARPPGAGAGPPGHRGRTARGLLGGAAAGL